MAAGDRPLRKRQAIEPFAEVFTYPLAALSPVKKVCPPFPGGWFAVDDDETRVRLVTFPPHGIELPQSVFCFAFLREVDSIALVVHVALPLLSRVLSSPQISTPANHLGHQNGHHEYSL